LHQAMVPYLFSGDGGGGDWGVDVGVGGADVPPQKRPCSAQSP
jgi:hypothetical protein